LVTHTVPVNLTHAVVAVIPQWLDSIIAIPVSMYDVNTKFVHTSTSVCATMLKYLNSNR